jgi:hypothetical protein
MAFSSNTVRYSSQSKLELRRTRAKGQGALLELVLAAGIIAFGFIGLNEYQTKFSQSAKAITVADYLSSLSIGALSYVTANSTAIQNDITAAGGGPITIALGPTVAGGATAAEPDGLVSPVQGGYLPSTFVAVDGYGQTVELLVKPDPDNSNALSGLIVTTGGQNIPDNIDGEIINKIGVSGGFYPNSILVASEAGEVNGLYGGWSTQASSWNSIPTAGHPAVTLNFGAAQTGLTDYLVRYNLGSSEPNTMHTNILMTQNSISNANDVDTGTLTNVNGTSTVAAGDISVGLVNATHVVTKNEKLDVSGILSDDTQLNLYNDAPLVWAANGTSIPTNVSLRILDGGVGPDPYLDLEGPLGLYISDATYATGVVDGNSGIFDTPGSGGSSSAGNGIGQFGLDNNVSEAMTANDGILSLDEPASNDASNGGPGIHIFGNGGPSAASANYEWDDLGKAGLILQANAAGTGNEGNITLFNSPGYNGGNIILSGGGNVKLDSGSVIANAGNIEADTGNVTAIAGYVRTGAIATTGAACTTAGALANAAGYAHLLFCSGGTWQVP